jgi:hypothetical protein
MPNAIRQDGPNARRTEERQFIADGDGIGQGVEILLDQFSGQEGNRRSQECRVEREAERRRRV